MSECGLCDQQDQITTLILNRSEEHNAMSPDLLAVSCNYLERLEAAAETQVLVIHGQGRRACRDGSSPA